MELKLMSFLPENWLNALGNTLFHSLWLGVLMALLSGMVVFLTSKQRATLRYNLLVVSLVLFVGATTFVFAREIQQSKTLEVYQSLTTKQNLQNTTHSGAYFFAERRATLNNVIDQLLYFWQQYAAQIVLIWFLVICFKSLQMLTGLRGIYQLRHKETYGAGKLWEDKLQVLCKRLEVSQTVKILQSRLAQVPMVIGHFKPLVLVPLGLLNGLSATAVEAVLAHELAHVKRRDYLVNFLQSFIEIIFFFNPAVMWVSYLIRTEREHCCDDLAIACVQDRKNYVKALIFCQEFKRSAPAYAMAINGKKGKLLNRASRMLFNTNSTLNKMEKTILSCALVSVVICTAAIRNESRAKMPSNTQMTSYHVAVQDTAKKKAQKAREKQVSSENLEKEINEKVLKAEKEHLEKSRKTEKQKREQASDQRQHLSDQQRYLREQKKYIDEQKRYADEQRKYAAEQKRYHLEASRVSKESGNMNTPKVPPAPPLPAAAPLNQYVPKAIPTPKVPATPPSPAIYKAPPAPPLQPKNIGNVEVEAGRNVNLKSGVNVSVKTNSARKVTTKSVTNGDGKDYSDEINQDLLRDHIITSLQNLSYKLNKNNLIVNGQKLEGTIHQKYKEKYLKNSNHSLLYNYSVSNW